MRHKVAGKLFHRNANQRKALLRCLVSSLFEHQRIETTVSKARETRKIAERLITLGKRGDLHAKRIVMATIPNRSLVVKLFDDIAPRLASRPGGYLRITKTRVRVNDCSEMAVLEFVDYEDIQAQMAEKKNTPKAKEA